MNLGRKGESIACRFLEERGHTVIDRNWRSGHLEIDIVSMDGAGLHFTEVKSRTAPYAARPEENVGYYKQQKLIRAAKAYLNSLAHKGVRSDFEIFFDILSVVFDGPRTEITYFPSAFLPIYV